MFLSRLLHTLPVARHVAPSRLPCFVPVKFQLRLISRNSLRVCNNVEKGRERFKLGLLPSTVSSIVLSELQNNSSFRSHEFCTYQKHFFHTSPQRNIHPLLLMFLNQGARVASILGGKLFRKWWRGLTPVEKQKYKDHILKRRQIFVGAAALLVLAFLVHYYQHLQTTPITNRRRYIALTPKQFMQIAHFEYQQQYDLVKDKIIPGDNAAYRYVTGIVRRIVIGNQDLDFFKEQEWTVILVDTPEANAAVLPTGHIFVNAGMVLMTENEDQLAVVLGHEMAHALLNHGAESISYATMLNFVVIAVMAALWAFLPSDGLAFVAEWFYKTVVNILLELPYSRKLELEADEVGLQLTAKACYDIRESSVFWKLMAARAESDNQIEIPEFISTHPASDFRAETLETLIPKAIKLRESCNCPALPAKDPRDAVLALHSVVTSNPKENVALKVSHDAKKN